MLYRYLGNFKCLKQKYRLILIKVFNRDSHLKKYTLGKQKLNKFNNITNNYNY